MPATPAVRRDSRRAAWLVWAPWFAAPLFCLLPIGGCAVADAIRHAAVQSPAPPLPGPAAVQQVPRKAVATILTAASR